MFTRAALELIASWRQLASAADLPFELVWRGMSPNRPATAPSIVESGWEMVYPEGSSYRVRAGSTLSVELPAAEPRTEGELFLWAGPVSAMVMWACGVFPLHASGLHLPAGTAAVFAPPGGGKSTLAALALEHGIQVQGDDLLGITREGGVVPRHGSLRIDSSRAPTGGRPDFILSDGRGWYPLRPVPAELSALLLLRRGPVAALIPVQGHRRLAFLLSAGFLSRYDSQVPPGWQEILLDFCAKLPVWELQVPEGLDRLRASWDEILGLLEQSQLKGAVQ